MAKVIRTKSDNIDFQELVKFLDDELNSRYGIVQLHYDQYNKIESLDTVVIAYLDKSPVACGCFKAFDESCIEIKRMIVKPENRGKGIADRILEELEKWAIEMGFSGSVLETGIKQPEAIRFYMRNGYIKIANYGQYIGNENSVCMGKQLMPL
jgi:putative acetyltransferase